MSSYNGYLLISDISGYTSYLTSSELEHANPILQSLLSSLVEQVSEPLHLWKMEGDAVLAYSTSENFPDGETFLGICENLYNSFATKKQNIIANTSCPCRACANVSSLDLKIIAHYGSFEEIQVGPIKDISGADVILVHRMAKTDVREVTGISSYALFSEAAATAMKIDAALTGFSQTFEHFGEQSMKVYDLARAWQDFRANRERHFLREEDGIFTFTYQLNQAPAVVWEAMVSPEYKQRWMSMLSVTVDRPQGRIGPGSGYHCAHDDFDFYYWVTDWEPFSYFSTRINDPIHEGVAYQETYELIPNDEGTMVRYTMGPGLTEDGVRNTEAEEGAVSFLRDDLWPKSFKALEELLQSQE